MTGTVHVYLFDGYADWEPAFAMAGIQNPQHQREPRRWRVRTVGERRGRPVRSMGGLAALPELDLQALDPVASAMLILPGGARWDEPHAHRAAIAAAGAFLAQGVPVAAICGATAGLARAGLLDGRPHTSNAASYLKGTGYAGSDAYVDTPAVRADGLITAGGMAPVESRARSSPRWQSTTTRRSRPGSSSTRPAGRRTSPAWSARRRPRRRDGTTLARRGGDPGGKDIRCATPTDPRARASRRRNSATARRRARSSKRWRTSRKTAPPAPAPRCRWPWDQLYVTAAGELLPCCMVATADRASFGNVFDDRLRERWHDAAAQSFRKGLAQGAPPAVCRSCALYQGLF
jgi:radical SAM protein with 4Fe4S-binding SPASM domain